MSSKVASKSSLSPSTASPSSNRIDLGKNEISGGRSQVSVSSGGIGITQEITSIGGVQISGGVSVDISPLEFEVSSNGRDTVSVAGSAEIPGGVLGLGGGISINTSTGEIKGGSVSGEVAGIGIEVSKNEDGFGLGISLQIPFTPISIELGFGSKNEEEKETPTPTPTQSPTTPNPFPPGALPAVVGSDTQSCTVIVALEQKKWELSWGTVANYTHWNSEGTVTKNETGALFLSGKSYYVTPPFDFPPFSNIYPNWQQATQPSEPDSFVYSGFVGFSGRENKVYDRVRGYHYYLDYGFIIQAGTYKIIYSDCPLTATPTPTPSPTASSSFPPFPNPPPRKRNMDECCRESIKSESGMARQEAIKGYLASKAIIKYMAFKSSEIDVPVPMTFTAGAESISELLKESEGHIKGTDYAEKETLRDVYLDLLQAAAIIRAVHWQRIDTKTNTKSQLLNILKGSVNLAAEVAKSQTNNSNPEKTFDPEKNFEDFIDLIEDGFRSATGITDAQNPYGKTPDRRPRIRQIGDNISQAGTKD